MNLRENKEIDLKILWVNSDIFIDNKQIEFRKEDHNKDLLIKGSTLRILITMRDNDNSLKEIDQLTDAKKGRILTLETMQNKRIKETKEETSKLIITEELIRLADRTEIQTITKD